jgi:hypothetical protein
MTTTKLGERVTRLEQRRNPPPRDPRLAEEAREIVLRQVLALAATLEPTNPIEHDFDVVAALTALARGRP